MIHPLDEELANLNQQKKNITRQIRYLYIERGAAIQKMQQYQHNPNAAELMSILRQQIQSIDNSIQFLNSSIINIDNQIHKINTDFSIFRTSVHHAYFGKKKKY